MLPGPLHRLPGQLLGTENSQSLPNVNPSSFVTLHTLGDLGFVRTELCTLHTLGDLGSHLSDNYELNSCQNLHLDSSRGKSENTHRIRSDESVWLCGASRGIEPDSDISEAKNTSMFEKW